MNSPYIQYITESGAIITPDNHALTILTGTPGQVDFPEEMIWQLHQKNPGIVYKLAHVHPPEMTSLSHRDKQTMETWAYALYPFPIRMSTIIAKADEYDIKVVETTYLGYLEPKEFWMKRKKDTPTHRDFTILQERQETFDGGLTFLNDWQTLLVQMSYTFK